MIDAGGACASGLMPVTVRGQVALAPARVLARSVLLAELVGFARDGTYWAFWNPGTAASCF